MAVATAQILYQRFWYTSSMKQFSIGVRQRFSLSPLIFMEPSLR